MIQHHQLKVKIPKMLMLERRMKMVMIRSMMLMRKTRVLTPSRVETRRLTRNSTKLKKKTNLLLLKLIP
jgi:hypothetical protein